MSIGQKNQSNNSKKSNFAWLLIFSLLANLLVGAVPAMGLEDSSKTSTSVTNTDATAVKPTDTPITREPEFPKVWLDVFKNEVKLENVAPFYKGKSGYLISLSTLPGLFEAEILWKEESNTIIINRLAQRIFMIQDSSKVVVEGAGARSFEMPEPVRVIDSRHYIPFNSIMEIFQDCSYQFSNNSLYVRVPARTITKPQPVFTPIPGETPFPLPLPTQDTTPNGEFVKIRLFLNDKEMFLNEPIFKAPMGFLASAGTINNALLLKIQEDGNTIFMYNGFIKMFMKLDSNILFINGQEIPLEEKARKIRNTTYLPLKGLANIIKYFFKYKPEGIFLYSQDPSIPKYETPMPEKRYTPYPKETPKRQYVINNENPDKEQPDFDMHRAAITQITTIVARGNSIFIKWEPSNLEKNKFKGYNLYRSLESGVIGKTPVTDFLIKGEDYIDKNVEPGKTYYYVCRIVFNDGSESSPSNESKVSLNGRNIVLQLDNPIMVVDGKEKNIEENDNKVSPILYSGRTILPIRALLNHLGGKIEWDSTEGKITITLEDKIVELWLGKTYTRVNGVEETTDVPPISINGRTMMPLRFITDKLGCTVDWDSENRKITIFKEKNFKEDNRSDNPQEEKKSEKIKITLDGNYLPTIHEHIMENRIVFMPLEFMQESLGFKTSFDNKTGEIVIISRNGTEKVKLILDKTDLIRDYGTTKMPYTPFIRGEKVYIPLQAVLESIGYNYLLYYDRMLVELRSPKAKSE